ncbi:DUF2759 family protein [Paracerasibacillus soli]|uniref:DUF2759 family protein n=1 Tax=Paracerasibacillus soli TaxID=480284 RepID=A0ABU5CQ08_9BACI|nr:DUF2759 family protein [Virgibacillus soli]MDY0408437.1 DUF2759 family protein [Virgibacillus soli]
MAIAFSALSVASFGFFSVATIIDVIKNSL